MTGDVDPTARLARAEVEVPASPEEVWEAITTGGGAWLFPADIEAREGGAMVIHRQPYASAAEATVTAWEPPHRFGFREPVPGAPPLATEFLVAARDGGTCVVRVVCGFYHDGEGWEDLVEGAGEGWRMALRILRCYLTHFAGQASANFDAMGDAGRPLGDRVGTLAAATGLLGLTGVAAGDPFRTADDAPPLAGIVEHAGPDFVLLRATAPGPALFGISSLPMDGVTVTVNVSGRWYGPDRAAVAEREGPRWHAWLADHFS